MDEDSFDDLSREELVDLLRKVLKENVRLKSLQNSSTSSQNAEENVDNKTLEFGSYGSSNVMFLKSADHR
jgi:hypothetical protein